MSYGKRGLKALMLSILAALGLMAFTAVGAQAQSFLVQDLTAPWSDVPISGTADDPLTNKNRLWILGLNIEIYCHGGSASGKINSNGHGHGHLLFTSCFAHGVNSSGELVGEPCKLDHHVLAEVLVLVILHSNGKPYILFEPLMVPGENPLNETFATLNTEPCPIPSAPVKGSVVASISNPDADSVTKLLSTKGNLTLFSFDKLFYGKNEAHLDADANVALAGTHVGDTFGAS